MPILLVMLIALVLEILLRFETWDSFIKPKSYLGNAIYRLQAIEKFGLENIHWITIGDSRIDWGLEHNKLFSVQKHNGLNHLRMSFESSNFMALQATIDWSISHMPNLKGILLGVAEDNFGHYSSVTNQYNVAWPFRDYFNYDNYRYFDDYHNYYSYITRSAIAVYYRDLKRFFRGIIKRANMIEYYLKSNHDKTLQFNRSMEGNICGFQLEDLKQCVNTSKDISKKKTSLNGAERFILAVCHTSSAQYLLENELEYYKLNEQTRIDITHNWQKLFSSILSKQIKLKLVLLPEHPMYGYMIKPSDAHEVVEEALISIDQHSDFELLDLRRVLKTNSQTPECGYYMDPLHYNNLGKSRLTQKIIDSLENNLNLTDLPKIDIINKGHFE